MFKNSHESLMKFSNLMSILRVGTHFSSFSFPAENAWKLSRGKRATDRLLKGNDRDPTQKKKKFKYVNLSHLQTLSRLFWVTRTRGGGKVPFVDLFFCRVKCETERGTLASRRVVWTLNILTWRGRFWLCKVSEWNGVQQMAPLKWNQSGRGVNCLSTGSLDFGRRTVKCRELLGTQKKPSSGKRHNRGRHWSRTHKWLHLSRETWTVCWRRNKSAV